MNRTTINWDDTTDDAQRLDILVDRFNNNPNETDCSLICDMLIQHHCDLDTLDSIYCIATNHDPTESGHAAHIRDTMRDNYTADELDGIL